MSVAVSTRNFGRVINKELEYYYYYGKHGVVVQRVSVLCTVV